MKVRSLGNGLYSIGANYYSPALTVAAKGVPGIRYEPASREWYGYADAVIAAVARLRAQHPEIQITGADVLPDPLAWKTSLVPYAVSRESLRGYQLEGVKFILAKSHEGCLLADGMRLGKSIQFVRAARALKKRTLIIAPSNAIGVWARPPEHLLGPGEIAKWWRDAWNLSDDYLTDNPNEHRRGVVVLEGVKPAATQEFLRKHGSSNRKTDKNLTPEILKKLEDHQQLFQTFLERIKHANVIVVSFDIVYAWVDVLIAWGVEILAVDESHALQGWKSRRTQAVAEIAQTAPRRVFLTGTPMTSRTRDLHSVVDVLCPGRFGLFFTRDPDDPKKVPMACFSKHYCNAHQETVGRRIEDQKVVWNFDGASNVSPDEITPPALVPEESLNLRLRHLMLRRTKQEVDKELPQKIRKIIDVAIPAKKMILPSYEAIQNKKLFRQALDFAADGKLPSVVEICKQHVEEGEKVFCVTYRRAFAEELAKRLNAKNIPAVYVHGGVSDRQREWRIAEVKNSKKPMVLVGSIDTCSTAIDLSFCSTEVIGELSWEPHDFVQVEERIYKVGAHTATLIEYVIARGTGDELIAKAIIEKLDVFEKAIGAVGDGLKDDLLRKKEMTEEKAMEGLRSALKKMREGAEESATKKKTRKKASDR